MEERSLAVTRRSSLDLTVVRRSSVQTQTHTHTHIHMVYIDTIPYYYTIQCSAYTDYSEHCTWEASASGFILEHAVLI